MEVVKASLPVCTAYMHVNNYLVLLLISFTWQDVQHSSQAPGASIQAVQQRKSSRYDHILNCITLLTISLKSHIKQDITELLEPVLQTGLSQALTSCLTEVTAQIPSLKKDVSDGLLKILSSVLMNQPWRHPGMPPIAKLMEHPKSEVDNSSIVLALNTLARFDLDGMDPQFNFLLLRLYF